MRITDFANLIREIPYLYQSFDIKKSVWLTGENQKLIIKQIFDGKEIITISRFDLFSPVLNLQEFVIMVLMWGYPTKGRGKNIENVLRPENFDTLIYQFQILIEKKNVMMEDVEKLRNIEGLGLSTLSKLLYFKKLKIESNPAMILDRRVINAINGETRFVDSGIEQFRELKYENGGNYYIRYLAFLDELAAQMNVKPDQIEMFLYEFGTNLKIANK